MSSPSVFVSHASEDKDSFVLAFAEKLLATGINAWVDKWEIKAGDSLVRKIFDEGLKNCNAVIVVLSQNSVIKPGVKDELDLAVVKRIGEGTRIIPVVLDDCEVPQSLRATKWVSFKDAKSYDEAFDEIVSVIFGHSDKPKLGKPPAYVSEFMASGVSGHNNIDSLVTKLVCEGALTNDCSLISEGVFKENGKLIIPEKQLRDSLEYLDEYGTVKLTRYLDDSFPVVEVTYAGFELYAREFVRDYEIIQKNLFSLIINEGVVKNKEMKMRMGIPPYLVDHIIRVQAGSGNIKVIWYLDGSCDILEIKQSFKRLLN